MPVWMKAVPYLQHKTSIPREIQELWVGVCGRVLPESGEQEGKGKEQVHIFIILN